MTYPQDKKPWRIAHKIDLFTLHEIAIERAVPNVIPYFTISFPELSINDIPNFVVFIEYYQL